MSLPKSSIYPQAHPMTFEEVENFLDLPLIAKLSSHNKDGSIHSVPIWFKYQEGKIFFGTQKISQKVQNIKRDAHVTVLVDTTEPTLKGVIIYGLAEIVTEDVIPSRISIFERYMKPTNANDLAANLAKKWIPVVIRVTPTSIISYDYSKGFGLSANSESIEI